ncbi:unnamed protein product [Eruca vesicaria subsp. sativa]|uniref:F-box domain-containing protein n=1 Tax=Eruca vesicaria subsp. sativa TaxID=29727 RepID=A0ABC8M7J1_ERUVS|nr:unnamed protein product [Eruca vesicaria subsp. sativa]
MLTRKAIQDSETCVAREITHDLLIEILARLPAKSVLRLKCLSKFWSSLFCSRYFCDRFFIVPSRPQPRLFMSLYYLAWTDMHTCVLVSFDMRSEEFDMIKVPRKPGDIGPSLKKRVTLIEYGGGKIAVFDFTYLKKTGTVDLWVVEDWRNKEWSSKTLVLQPSQMYLVTDNRLTPKGTTLKDKVFLIPEKLVSPFYFLCYDLRTNDLRKYEIKGIPDHWFSKPEATKDFDMEFMDSNGSIKYLET